MMIGYCSFGQGGQYLAILQDGYCIDAATQNYSWSQNPKIIVIDPNGTITETQLTAANSLQDLLEHTAEFNVAVSQIINQGYTINPAGTYSTAGNYSLGVTYASYLQWPDALCPEASVTYSGSVVSLIPCCTPP